MMKSDRLIIRRFKATDAEDLFEYLGDHEVLKYEPYDVMTMKACLYEAKVRAESKAFYAVEYDHKLIGNLYVSQVEPSKINTYEIGYVFNRQFHGKGFASEAVRRLMEELFFKRDAHRIIAHCNVENEASWKLLERIGMRREAKRVKNMFFKRDVNNKPIWFDSYQYALLCEEYKKS